LAKKDGTGKEMGGVSLAQRRQNLPSPAYLHFRDQSKGSGLIKKQVKDCRRGKVPGTIFLGEMNAGRPINNVKGDTISNISTMGQAAR